MHGYMKCTDLCDWPKYRISLKRVARPLADMLNLGLSLLQTEKQQKQKQKQ